MPTSGTGKQTTNSRRAVRLHLRASGFTLLEILVVIVIIGIFIGVAALSTDIVDFNTEMQREARRMESVLQLASEDAVLQSEDYGLKFYDDGYDFLVFDHTAGIWRPSEAESVLVRHMLDRMLLEIWVEDRKVELTAAGEELVAPADAEGDEDGEQSGADDEDEEELRLFPDVVIYSSGEFTPFELRILNGIDPLEPAVVLSVEFDGKTEIGNDEL